MSAAVVWITGAHGFIGRNLGRFLADQGHKVVGIGHGPWTNARARSWGISHWLNGEIVSSNLSELRGRAGSPSAIVHLAGGSSVGAAIAQPREDFIRTVNTTVELFEWIRQHCPDSVVVSVSSAAIYGVGHIGQITETATARPLSPYGYHKLMMEAVCKSYANSYGLKSVVARLFSVYGEGLRKQLLWDLCTKLSCECKTVELDGAGNELRDWTEVRDVVRILGNLIPLASAETPIINVGHGRGVAVREVVKYVVSAWNEQDLSGLEVIFSGRSRPGDPFSLIADPTLLHGVGLGCLIPLEVGIIDYVRWFRKQSAL